MPKRPSEIQTLSRKLEFLIGNTPQSTWKKQAAPRMDQFCFERDTLTKGGLGFEPQATMKR